LEECSYLLVGILGYLIHENRDSYSGGQHSYRYVLDFLESTCMRPESVTDQLGVSAAGGTAFWYRQRDPEDAHRLQSHKMLSGPVGALPAASP
jgi:hypothetical protein